MGLLSDFLVADRTEASAIGATLDRKKWPTFQSKGFTVLELGLLHFAMTGEDADAPVSPPQFAKNPYTGKEFPLSVGTIYIDDFICLDDREESWMHEVPASLVEEIADAGDLEAVAARWAEYEELETVGPGELADVLRELQRLARIARAEKKSLLLWTSL